MNEQTLHFDTARAATDLTALPTRIFSGVEQTVDGSLTTRDIWLKIEDLAFVTLGEEEVVRRPLVQRSIRAYPNYRNESPSGRKLIL